MLKWSLFATGLHVIYLEPSAQAFYFQFSSTLSGQIIQVFYLGFEFDPSFIPDATKQVLILT